MFCSQVYVRSAVEKQFYHSRVVIWLGLVDFGLVDVGGVMKGGRTLFVDAVHVRVGHFVALFRLNEIDELSDDFGLAAPASQMQRSFAHLFRTNTKMFKYIIRTNENNAEVIKATLKQELKHSSR